VFDPGFGSYLPGVLAVAAAASGGAGAAAKVAAAAMKASALGATREARRLADLAVGSEATTLPSR
jgi:hypothetical protein